jgi:hypothetical protein
MKRRDFIRISGATAAPPPTAMPSGGAKKKRAVGC